MAFTPVKGKFAALSLLGTIQPCVNYSLPITANLEDVSNFRDGRARCATLDDADGITFQVVHDEASPITTTLKPGVFGTLNAYVDAAQTKSYGMVVCIGQVTVNNQGVNQTLKLDVSASLHGTISYPS